MSFSYKLQTLKQTAQADRQADLVIYVIIQIFLSILTTFMLTFTGIQIETDASSGEEVGSSKRRKIGSDSESAEEEESTMISHASSTLVDKINASCAGESSGSDDASGVRKERRCSQELLTFDVRESEETSLPATQVPTRVQSRSKWTKWLVCNVVLIQFRMYCVQPSTTGLEPYLLLASKLTYRPAFFKIFLNTLRIILLNINASENL